MSWTTNLKTSGIQYVSIRGPWTSLVWLSKNWVPVLLKKISLKTSSSTHLLRPKYGFPKFSKCQNFQNKTFKVIIIYFCASPIYLYDSVLFFFSLSYLFMCRLFFLVSYYSSRCPVFILFLNNIDCLYICCYSSYICVLFLLFLLLSLLFFSMFSYFLFFCFALLSQQHFLFT